MSGGGEGGADGAPPGPSKRPKVDHDATPRHLRAVEFYCGVGGLHYSLLRARPGAKVVAAFDINPNGNDTYEHNFGVRPSQKNIYGLPVSAFDKLDGGDLAALAAVPAVHAARPQEGQRRRTLAIVPSIVGRDLTKAPRPADASAGGERRGVRTLRDAPHGRADAARPRVRHAGVHV